MYFINKDQHVKPYHLKFDFDPEKETVADLRQKVSSLQSKRPDSFKFVFASNTNLNFDIPEDQKLVYTSQLCQKMTLYAQEYGFDEINQPEQQRIYVNVGIQQTLGDQSPKNVTFRRLIILDRNQTCKQAHLKLFQLNKYLFEGKAADLGYDIYQCPTQQAYDLIMFDQFYGRPYKIYINQTQGKQELLPEDNTSIQRYLAQDSFNNGNTLEMEIVWVNNFPKVDLQKWNTCQKFEKLVDEKQHAYDFEESQKVPQNQIKSLILSDENRSNLINKQDIDRESVNLREELELERAKNEVLENKLNLQENLLKNYQDQLENLKRLLEKEQNQNQYLRRQVNSLKDQNTQMSFSINQNQSYQFEPSNGSYSDWNQ